MIPPICFITDADAPRPIVEQAIAAARGGVGLIQLRHKTLPDAEFAEIARRLMAVLPEHGAMLAINDRIEVAQAVAAPALHIGQGDGDPARIRKRIGPDVLLGLSVEDAGQLAAVPKGVDYLGVGPVRATASKPDHAPPIGLDGLARIVGQSKLPCIAIGRLVQGDIPDLKALGAAGIAVVSAISRAEDMEAAARGLVQAWGRA
ncbi:thiamine phosphate synthase [Paracoccus albus]|uniref:thiamine phosphate synthase n=1 Tax=Paracoccus albus TaxID=3017784 RepID=UPI0022EFF170|nr:thiamine phosphate synthase [Paracoccus albus]WBU61710.1 thiamine phosphate synthase [Paracoccus albus]